MAPLHSSLALLPRSNSPDHNAKGTQSAVSRSEDLDQPPTACKYVVSGTISLPALGCFSPVPHGTRSLSVTQESLALEGGPPSFTPDSSYRALLRNSTTHSSWSSPTGLSPSMALLSRRLRLTSLYASVGPTTPAVRRPPVWAIPVSLAATQGISFDFSFLEVLRCFSSLGLLSPKRVTVIADSRVSPFGNSGITVCVPLPLTYRSLPRPSSPLCTQASPTYSCSLDQFFIAISLQVLSWRPNA